MPNVCFANSTQQDTQFRSYLLTALHNFAISKRRHDHAQKRAPGKPLESLEDTPESEYLECADPKSPASAAFDIAWARAVVAEALNGMETECRQNGRKLLWIIF